MNESFSNTRNLILKSSIILKPIDLVRDSETVVKARASPQPLVGGLLVNVISVGCSALKLSYKTLQHDKVKLAPKF